MYSMIGTSHFNSHCQTVVGIEDTAL